jgi:thiosulfate/3-mercaptopyruvate sulfurtransferase
MTIWRSVVDADRVRARLAADGAAAVQPLRVFDCRFSLADAQAGDATWWASRIPTARYAHLDRDLSNLRPPHVPGSGRHPWPQADVFRAWLTAQGVGPGTQVVAYDAGDGAFAARLWALLRALGHEAVAVLDGGWAHWNALGLPVENGAPTAREAQDAASANSHLTGESASDASGFEALPLLDAPQVAVRLAAGDALIDARAGERFRGEVEPIDRVAGHVPGAINRPYALNLQDGRFKSGETLREEFLGILAGRSPSQAVAMCGSGVTACHHLLAMAHAGLEGAALFTGSWSGWIEDPQRLVATGAV